MRRDDSSPWHVCQLARRMVARRLSLVASMRASGVRDPQHGETPLSADEVAFGIRKGLILGPIDLRGLHAGSQPLQPGVPALRRQDDPGDSSPSHPRGSNARSLSSGAQGLDGCGTQRSGSAPAGEGDRS